MPSAAPLADEGCPCGPARCPARVLQCRAGSSRSLTPHSVRRDRGGCAAVPDLAWIVAPSVGPGQDQYQDPGLGGTGGSHGKQARRAVPTPALVSCRPHRSTGFARVPRKASPGAGPAPDLLTADNAALRPLAERMRPRTLDEMVGQRRLVSPDSALRTSIEAGAVHSMVLWGPPGCGKTTLALLLARYADADFRSVSAVLSGLPEVRQVLAEAGHRFAEGRRTVLFVDEVHRFNKAQQDAFLPHIERGTIVFVGATTENPSFELNSALLSRCRVHVMEAVSADDIRLALQQAL